MRWSFSGSQQSNELAPKDGTASVAAKVAKATSIALEISDNWEMRRRKAWLERESTTTVPAEGPHPLGPLLAFSSAPTRALFAFYSAFCFFFSKASSSFPRARQTKQSQCSELY